MDETLIHILIVWSKGKPHLAEIATDLSKTFNILNVFDFAWKKELFHENLKRFYAHSQKEKSETEFNAIIKGKIEHCGDDSFSVIIFEDNNPVFESRKTSNGISTVNINVFDKKAKYRSLTGGGHKIHASDNYFESNKDIALLLNTTLKDYKNSFEPSSVVVKKENNIIGVPYWKSVNDLFFALNNSIEYVVLRNFECLPDDYHVEGHGDIDLLVEDFNYVKYLTGAKTVFPELDYRVYHYININNEEVPFDFRFFGDNYYDKKWEFNILENKKLEKDGFYIPDQENYFYSLLYHAFIHKRHMSEDYKARLAVIAKTINIDYNTKSTLTDIAELLNIFLQSNGYNYSLPIDQSVFFNKKNSELIKIENKIEGLGQLVNSSTTRTADKSFFTEVYVNDDSYVKIASYPVSFNENKFLTLLNDSSYFPKILSFENIGDYDKVTIQKINGFSFLEINDKSAFWTKKEIKNFINQLLDILIQLNKKKIIHRDIRPNNLVVVKNETSFKPVLIDFGWSISEDETASITPLRLGDKYKPEIGFSDAYSVALCIKEYLGKFDFTNNIIKDLIEVYKNNNSNHEKIELIRQRFNSATKLTTNDRKQFFVKRTKATIGVKNVTKVMTFLKKFK